jgi:hypothetical protein
MLRYKSYACYLKKKDIQNNCVQKPAPIANTTYGNSSDYINKISICCSAP